MNYFKSFRIIDGYQIQDKVVVGIDLTRRLRIPSDLKDNPALYMEYTIRNGDTPEILADRVYDDVNEYWIICVFNNIIDIEEDWPMEQSALDGYVLNKYSNPYGIHHYVSASTGAIVDADHVSYDRVAVTNYQYEVDVNDSKRNIKILLPEFKSLMTSFHRGN